jgi:hypothetical protein
MKLFVSTKKTQGQRRNDFSFVPEGELLIFETLLTSCGDDPDGRCGCGRAMIGMESLTATTTMAVADVPISKAALRVRIFNSLKTAGWSTHAEQVDGVLDLVVSAAQPFDVGAIVERRGRDVFHVREEALCPVVSAGSKDEPSKDAA